MPIHFRPLSCPHCQQKLTTETLHDRGCRDALIKRQAFPCPLCKAQVQLPERWEKVVSTGLLLAVIVAPLSYYWQLFNQGALVLLALGAAMVILGGFKQQLEPGPGAISNSKDGKQHD